MLAFYILTFVGSINLYSCGWNLNVDELRYLNLMFAGTSSNPSLVQNLYQNRCLTHVTSPCGEKSCCCLKSHKSQWIFLDSQLVYHDISYHSSPVDQKNRLFQPTYPIETVVHSSKFLFNLILSIRFFVFVKVNLAIINQGYIPFNHHFAW